MAQGDDVDSDYVFEKIVDWQQQLKNFDTIRIPRHYQGDMHRPQKEEAESMSLSCPHVPGIANSACNALRQLLRRATNHSAA